MAVAVPDGDPRRARAPEPLFNLRFEPSAAFDQFTPPATDNASSCVARCGREAPIPRRFTYWSTGPRRFLLRRRREPCQHQADHADDERAKERRAETRHVESQAKGL